MRGTVAMTIANAPGLYVGFLMGREHAWRATVPKQWAGEYVSTQVKTLGLDSHDKELQQKADCAIYPVLICEFVEVGLQPTSREATSRK